MAGFIVAYAMFKGAIEPGTWKSLAALCGSWIGGTGNMVAVQGALNVNDSQMGYALIMDSINASVWIMVLLWGVSFAPKFNKWTKANTKVIDEIGAELAATQADVSKEVSFPDLMILVGLSLIVSAVSTYLGGILPQSAFLAGSTWTVLIATIFGVALAMTPVAKIPGSGRNIASGFYSGNTPVHMDAWSKMYLGFAEPKVISPTKGKKQTITLRPSSIAPDIFKIDVPGSNGREYFLLENRQQRGYDVGLSYNVDGNKLHGLAVYHIVNDILVRNFDRPNEAQNWDYNHTGLSNFLDPSTGEHHYGISLIQADGKYDMEKYVNDGDSGDLFPGKKNVTSLSSKYNSPINTTSLYKWSTSNTETGIAIQNIKENADGTVTCEVVFTK